MGMNTTGMQEAVQRCATVLREGGLILYPTDTVWGIGCDATNEAAVNKIYQLKNRPDTKAMICLVSNESMLEQYVRQVPSTAYDIIALATKPTTIVYDHPVGIATNLVASDDTLALRVASDPFCRAMIRYFKKPVVSTSANISGFPTPMAFDQIDKGILKAVDYIVPLKFETQNGNPSSIIRLGNDGTVKIIRE